MLARRGLSVTVIDPYAEFPPLFRAEKIEPDQAALLQSLGLLDKVKQKTRIISEIIHGRAGRMLRRRQIEQFGISYCDIVNQVRAQIPEQVEFRLGRVEKITPDESRPRVELADGSVSVGRLLILASGMSGRLPEQLGIEKRMVKQELSMAFGFMLERTDGHQCPHMHECRSVSLDHDDSPGLLRQCQAERQGKRKSHRVLYVEVFWRVMHRSPQIGGIAQSGHDEGPGRQCLREYLVVVGPARSRIFHHFASFTIERLPSTTKARTGSMLPQRKWLPFQPAAQLDGCDRRGCKPRPIL